MKTGSMVRVISSSLIVEKTIGILSKIEGENVLVKFEDFKNGRYSSFEMKKNQLEVVTPVKCKIEGDYETMKEPFMSVECKACDTGESQPAEEQRWHIENYIHHDDYTFSCPTCLELCEVSIEDAYSEEDDEPVG